MITNYQNSIHVDTEGKPLKIGKIYRIYGIPNPIPTTHTSNDAWDQHLVNMGLNKLVKIIRIERSLNSDLTEGFMEYIDGTKTPRWSSSDMQFVPYEEPAQGGKRSKRRKKRRKSKKN